MWWQILPSFGIITALQAVPYITCTISAYWGFGSTEGRDLNTGFTRMKFHRDNRIVGYTLWNEQKALGLDGIPDD